LVRTIKSECLNHFIFFGERPLQHVIREFMVHYQRERFHQGLGGELIEKQAGSPPENRGRGKVVRRSRLGGMLNFYHREAA
jgi:putative transposase